MIPRIRGKVGQIDDHPDNIKEDIGKWVYTVWLCFLGDGEGKELMTCGPYDTEELALAALKAECQKLCEFIEERIDGEKSGKYVDMKDNQTKDWVVH